MELNQPRAIDNAIAAERQGIAPAAHQMDLIGLIRMLWRRRLLVAGTIIVVMAFTAIVLNQIPPRFKATSFIEISPRQTNIVSFEAVMSGLPADSPSIETEIQIIRSRSNIAKAVEILRLDRDPEFNGALRAEGVVPDVVLEFSADLLGKLREATGFAENAEDEAASSEFDGDRARILAAGSPSESDSIFGELDTAQDEEVLSPVLVAKREKESITDAVLGRLTIDPQGRSRVIGISFESQQPDVSAAVANVISDLYIDSQIQAKYDAARGANAWLGERIALLRQEVEAAEQAVENYRRSSGLLQGGQEATLVSEQVSELNSNYVIEQTRLAEANARLLQVEKAWQSPGGNEAITEVLNAPLIRDLRRAEAGAESLIAELSQEFGERHPRMINARAELNDLRTKITNEVEKIIQGLRNEVAVARARASSVQGALESLKRDVAEVNTAEVELRALEREANASRLLLESLLARSKETVSQEGFQQADAVVISAAVIPKSPSFPSKKSLLLLSGLFSLALGFGLALTAENLDVGLRSADQIEQLFGLNALGFFPFVPSLRNFNNSIYEYIRKKPNTPYSESLRSLYINLMLSKSGKRPKTILIASSLPSEGKTSTVVALAHILAHSGQKVIVVDCDLRQPSVSKELKIESKPGLSEVILGTSTLEEAIVSHANSGAMILPAGGQPTHSTNMLDSVQFSKTLESLSKDYDIVLLDSAPILAVSDTLFLARQADRTVLIARWGKTQRHEIRLALKRLHDAQCQVTGIALSMVRVKEHVQYGFEDASLFHPSLKKYYAG